MTTDVEKQEGQKTVVSFAVGLLVGGLLVWAFSGSPETSEAPANTPEDNDTEMSTDDVTNDTTMEDGDVKGDTTTMDEPIDPVPDMVTGEASVSLGTVAAGSMVALDGATFPTDEGWIGVRTYTDGSVGSILGVSRYSKEQGLIPSKIELLAPMVAGRDYAVVFFAEDGDRDFNPALDAQLDVDVTPFTAQ